MGYSNVLTMTEENLVAGLGASHAMPLVGSSALSREPPFQCRIKLRSLSPSKYISPAGIYPVSYWQSRISTICGVNTDAAPREAGGLCANTCIETWEAFGSRSATCGGCPSQTYSATSGRANYHKDVSGWVCPGLMAAFPRSVHDRSRSARATPCSGISNPIEKGTSNAMLVQESLALGIVVGWYAMGGRSKHQVHALARS
ncbi:hypothetical protein GGI35DRAFT_101076 [Trichoderma velutinum]